MCNYISTRTKKKCDESPQTNWGFCSKHSQTLQARKARSIYEEQIEREKRVDEKNELSKEIEVEEVEQEVEVQKEVVEKEVEVHIEFEKEVE